MNCCEHFEADNARASAVRLGERELLSNVLEFEGHSSHLKLIPFSPKDDDSQAGDSCSWRKDVLSLKKLRPQLSTESPTSG